MTEAITAPLSQAPLLALLAANVVSRTSSMLTRVALSWFVLQTTRSAAKAGLLGFAIFLPGFAACILATGNLINLVGFRPSFIAIAACLQTLAIAMLDVPAFRELERPVAHPLSGRGTASD